MTRLQDPDVGRFGAAGDLPVKPDDIRLAAPAARRIDWRRAFFVALGLAAFAAVELSPPWPAAADPAGAAVVLGPEGRRAIALLLLATIWWGFEVMPVGVTAIAVGALQPLLLIRPAQSAFRDFMDPAVWFVLASLTIGLAFTRTGVARRAAYLALMMAGDRTRMIYLVAFGMTAVLSLVMPHTAVAATVYPLFMAICARYDDTAQPTRFGKGLFIGMAFAAGAGSIVTLLGCGRAPIALGYVSHISGTEISFAGLSYFMLPIGWSMVALIWVYCTLRFPPERTTVEGLRDRARLLYRRLGPVSHHEALAVAIVGAAIGVLVLRPLSPALQRIDEAAIIAAPAVLFYLFGILDLDDLGRLPWNLVLLFGGALSLGLCAAETGAARWTALHVLRAAGDAPALALLLVAATIVVVLTNTVINVVALAVCLPVALAAAHALGLPPEPIALALLAAAGMPFLAIAAAAPNAIAHESGQFTAREFFAAGVVPTLLFLVLLGLFASLIWPAMGLQAGG